MSKPLGEWRSEPWIDGVHSLSWRTLERALRSWGACLIGAHPVHGVVILAMLLTVEDVQGRGVSRGLPYKSLPHARPDEGEPSTPVSQASGNNDLGCQQRFRSTIANGARAWRAYLRKEKVAVLVVWLRSPRTTTSSRHVFAQSLLVFHTYV